MTENSLFQFAQVIAELPIPSTQSDPRLNQLGRRYVPIRKNACIVCSKCFTCSKHYGVDCTCQELQPRRGKNLPEGGVDSRAKKLYPEDRDDYEFSIKWINENVHNIYKNEHDAIVGLKELSEVSLCKAHSSTLYRAKKRHELRKNQAPPSPADSIKTTIRQQPQFINPYNNNSMTGGLATKVRELAYDSNKHHPFRVHEPTAHHFGTTLSHSYSSKRKRTARQSSPEPFTTSMSTPVYTNSITGSRSNYSHHLPTQQQQQQHHHNHHQHQHHNHFAPPMNNNHHAKQEQKQKLQFHSQQQQQIVDSFSSQLPPLQTRGVISGGGYPSSNSNTMVFRTIETPQPSPLTPQSASPEQQQELMVIETVSLKSMHSGEYYFRNLAITDSFTFRDLLAEIEIKGSPPPGKRIVISDAANEKIMYPMDQSIQSVLKRRSVSTHVELCLGLLDQPSINWSEYNIEQ